MALFERLFGGNFLLRWQNRRFINTFAQKRRKSTLHHFWSEEFELNLPYRSLPIPDSFETKLERIDKAKKSLWERFKIRLFGEKIGDEEKAFRLGFKAGLAHGAGAGQARSMFEAALNAAIVKAHDKYASGYLAIRQRIAEIDEKLRVKEEEKNETKDKASHAERSSKVDQDITGTLWKGFIILLAIFALWAVEFGIAYKVVSYVLNVNKVEDVAEAFQVAGVAIWIGVLTYTLHLVYEEINPLKEGKKLGTWRVVLNLVIAVALLVPIGFFWHYWSEMMTESLLADTFSDRALTQTQRTNPGDEDPVSRLARHKGAVEAIFRSILALIFLLLPFLFNRLSEQYKVFREQRGVSKLFRKGTRKQRTINLLTRERNHLEDLRNDLGRFVVEGENGTVVINKEFRDKVWKDFMARFETGLNDADKIRFEGMSFEDIMERDELEAYVRQRVGA